MLGAQSSNRSSPNESGSKHSSSSKQSSVKQTSSIKPTPTKLPPPTQSTSSLSSVNNGQNNVTSNNNTNRVPSPLLFDFDYIGRLVTHEQPRTKKSNLTQNNVDFSLNTQQDLRHRITPRYQEIYEEYEGAVASSDEDVYDLNKPFGVIRLDDKHYREIYRVPTPPPRRKQVFHRLQTPKTKIIERIYVHRPPQEIIENVLEVPPEKVRIITKEKYLSKSKPIIRTKVVYLKPRQQQQQQQFIEQQDQSAAYTYSPQVNSSYAYSPQVDSSYAYSPQVNSSYVYSPQVNSSYVYSPQVDPSYTYSPQVDPSYTYSPQVDSTYAEYTQPIISYNNSQPVSTVQTAPGNCYDFDTLPVQPNYSQGYTQYY